MQRHFERGSANGAGHVEVQLGDLVDVGQAAGGAWEEARVHADGLPRVEAGGVEGREQVGEVGEGVADCGHFPAKEVVDG